MSDFTVAWARKSRVGSTSARLILLELAYRADVFDFSCQVGINDLAEACELGRRTAIIALQRLEQLGLISRRRQYDEDGNREPDVYTLQLTTVVDSPRPAGRPRGRFTTRASEASVESEVMA